MKPIRILIVEDDVDFAEGLAEILRRRGYKIGLVNSGEEALIKFQHEDFDVALLDFKLPGINGIEVFQEFLKFKPEIKVLLVTGFNTEQILDQIVGSNCWSLLKKPFDKKNILDMLERIGPKGILIIDFDPDFIENIKNLLESEGKTVFFARSSQEVVKCAHSNGIDILILDFNKPIINELGIYNELKKTGYAIPTIIVTPHVEHEKDMIEGLETTSVSGILRKPLNPKELLDILMRIQN
jgi:CheY-like chemotaxis protein